MGELARSCETVTAVFFPQKSGWSRGLPSVHISQSNIHQYQVGHFRGCHLDPIGPVYGKTDREALARQPAPQHVAIHLVVFYKQDLGHLSSSISNRHSAYLT